jgi:hypothetical protein
MIVQVSIPPSLSRVVTRSAEENLDVDCRIKHGLNSTENDFSVTAGMTFGFQG